MEDENEIMQDIADISCEYGLEHADHCDSVRGFIWEFSEMRKRIKDLESNPLSQFTRVELLEEIRRRMED